MLNKEPNARPSLLERYAQERIDRILNNPGTHFWLRDAILTSLPRDPVDALNDSRLLFQLLQERWNAMLEAENFMGINNLTNPPDSQEENQRRWIE